MKKDNIVQFVCFTSLLEPEEFMEMWESYSNLVMTDPANILLQFGTPEKNGNRFNYILKHSCSAADFRFVFTDESSRSPIREQKARIKMAGGYLPVQLQSGHKNKKDDARVVAFVAHSEVELAFYRSQTFNSLNIFEAYFENCAYGYVMEFFLDKEEAPLLLAQLKSRSGVEAALYKECRASHATKKLSGSLL